MVEPRTRSQQRQTSLDWQSKMHAFWGEAVYETLIGSGRISALINSGLVLYIVLWKERGKKGNVTISVLCHLITFYFPFKGLLEFVVST